MSRKPVDTSLIIREEAEQLSKKIIFTVSVSVDRKVLFFLFYLIGFCVTVARCLIKELWHRLSPNENKRSV